MTFDPLCSRVLYHGWSLLHSDPNLLTSSYTKNWISLCCICDKKGYYTHTQNNVYWSSLLHFLVLPPLLSFLSFFIHLFFLFLFLLPDTLSSYPFHPFLFFDPLVHIFLFLLVFLFFSLFLLLRCFLFSSSRSLFFLIHYPYNHFSFSPFSSFSSSRLSSSTFSLFLFLHLLLSPAKFLYSSSSSSYLFIYLFWQHPVHLPGSFFCPSSIFIMFPSFFCFLQIKEGIQN